MPLLQRDSPDDFRAALTREKAFVGAQRPSFTADPKRLLMMSRYRMAVLRGVPESQRSTIQSATMESRQHGMSATGTKEGSSSSASSAVSASEGTSTGLRKRPRKEAKRVRAREYLSAVGPSGIESRLNRRFSSAWARGRY